MALVELEAQVRSEKGKGAARRYRQQGLVPGVLYGAGAESTRIAVTRSGFDRMLRQAHGGAIIIDLKLQGGKEKGLKALIKEVQHDPVTSNPVHLDLLRVSMDKPVHIIVPINLTGLATGVKNEGGFLDHVQRDVEVQCLPANIPDFLELDVTLLAVGDSLHVGDISHEGVEVLTPADRVVVTVHGKAVPEETPEEEAAAEAAAAEGEAGGEEAATKGEGAEKSE